MRKLWAVLSMMLVLGLVWCTIPVVGGWSWASDPVFDFDGEVVNVIVRVDSEDEPDWKQVKVELRVPDGTPVDLIEACGLNVNVKDVYKVEDQARLRVTVPSKKYKVLKVTVKGAKAVVQEQQDHEWVLTFALP
jgi:hypothetical protein